VKAGEQTEMSLVSVKMDKNEQKNQYLCSVKKLFSLRALGNRKIFM
jgi:hypothetical protein